MKRLLFILVNAVIGILTLLSAWGGMIPPYKWVIPSFMVMIFPVMVVVMLLLFIANLLFERKQVWMPTLVMIICAPQFLSFCPINFGGARKAAELESSEKFTFVTYNIIDFTNPYAPDRESPQWNPAVSWLLKTQPDLICLQESVSLDPAAHKHTLAEQLDSLSALYPYQFFETKMWNGILSKYPVRPLPAEKFPNVGTPVLPFVVTLPDGDSITVVSCHLQSLRLNDEDKALYHDMTTGATKSEIREFKHNVLTKIATAFRLRATQAEEISAYADSIGGNVIVCGDFNDVPGSYAEECFLNKGFIDTYSKAALGPTWTFNDQDRKSVV